MKVVCIDNVKRGGVILPLTIGKVYETDGLQSTLYRIRCDDDVSIGEFGNWRFVSLEEWRERQLRELGI